MTQCNTETPSPEKSLPARPRLFPAVLLSALLMTMAFPPVDWGWLAWVGLAPLFWALPRARRPRHAFALGYLFGITHWGATIYWIGTTVAAWTHSPVGWVAWILLTLIKSLWFGLFGVLAWWIGRRAVGSVRSRAYVRPAAIAAAWTLVEWLRGQSSIAMPWSLSGYTQYRYLPLIQAADLAGFYLVTFALAYVCAAIAEVNGSTGQRVNGSMGQRVNGSMGQRVNGSMGQRVNGSMGQWVNGSMGQPAVAVSPHRLIPSSPQSPKSPLPPFFPSSLLPLLPAFLLPGFLLIYGVAALHRSYDGAPLRLALMQPNIASRRSDSYALQQDLERYRRMASRVPAGSVDLVVWPESTVGEFLDEPSAQKEFAKLARQTGAFQLLGSGAVDEKGGVYNSAMLIAPDGRYADRYDKNWLVPMGEWVVMRPLLQHFDSVFHFPPDTVAGVQDRVMRAGQARLCVLICYESVFPIVSRTRSRAGSNLLIGITNDSWAGESSELQQHIAMVAFRAVENRRWLGSSATTGITGIIDPTGRIDALPPYREDVYLGTVRLRDEITFYTRFGDWFVACCGMGVAAVLFAGKRRPTAER